MSNVIAFLEAMGQDAAKSRLQGEEFTAAVDALGLDDAPRQALLQRDAVAIGDLLGGRHTVLCALFPADDDNQKDNDQDDDKGDSPDETKESVRLRGLN